MNLAVFITGYVESIFFDFFIAAKFDQICQGVLGTKDS